MTVNLPGPVAAYFNSDKSDSEAIAQCFTPDAVVKDEGRFHQGQSAIRQWKRETSAKFTYTSEPFAVEEHDGKTVVTSTVTGNFPGSPVILRYAFVINGGKIASLEIAP